MVGDPLSYAATVLPQSTFDPVRNSSMLRQEFLKSEADRNKRYNDLVSQLEQPGDWNANIRSQLITARNDLLNSGGQKMAEGYDITDVSNPKSSRMAMDYISKVNQLEADTQTSKAIEGLLATAKQTLLKDQKEKGEKGVFDPGQSIANIKAIENAPDLKTAKAMLAELGDNILVPAFHPVDVGAIVSKELPNYVSPTKYEETRIEGGKKVTEGYNEIDANSMQSAMQKIYDNDPALQKTIKQQMENDPTRLPNETPMGYFMRNYGTPKLKSKFSKTIAPYEPPSASRGTTKETMYEASPEPIVTTVSFGSGKNYDATGDNPFVFSQKKAFFVTPGPDAINITTGKPAGIKGGVRVTPVNTAEYTVSKNASKGWPKGSILPDSEKWKPGTERKRFVEVSFVSKGNTGTILVPYESISEELDKSYQIKKDLPELINYSEQQLVGIDKFMKSNNIQDREEAISILKANNKL